MYQKPRSGDGPRYPPAPRSGTTIHFPIALLRRAESNSGSREPPSGVVPFHRKQSCRRSSRACLLWTNTRRRAELASHDCLRVIASVAAGSGLGRVSTGPAPHSVRVGDHPRRTLAQELAGARDAHRGRAGRQAAFWPAERRRKPSTTLKEKDVKRTWRAKRPFQRPLRGPHPPPQNLLTCRHL
jgi:hypothetical protein